MCYHLVIYYYVSSSPDSTQVSIDMTLPVSEAPSAFVGDLKNKTACVFELCV